MKKSLWHWEKHDVVNYLRANFLESEIEFTTETLIKKIQKGKFFFDYTEKKLSKHLFELSKEGYLSVRYTSVEMKPYQNCSSRIEKRFGSKTIAYYKMVSREEKLNKILEN
jgi:hypothetical protein